MATKKKGRTDDGDLEKEDDDLEEEADDEETDDEAESDEEEEEGEGEDSGASKSKPKAKKETNEERLTRELKETKAALRTANRKEREASGKLTKAGITAEDDHVDLKAERDRYKEQLDARMAGDRQTQAREAIREVLLGDDDYAPYTKMSRYIMADLDPADDDDIDPDTGKYDEEWLADNAERAVAKFVKTAPKPSTSVKGQEGGDNGSAVRRGPGGVPARGSGKDSRSKAKETDAERLVRLDKQFGGVFTKTGLIPSPRR